MPLLALLLRKFFLEIVGFFGARVSAKFAVAAGAVVAMGVITGAFVAAIHAVVAGITLVWPEGIGFMLGMIPSSAVTYTAIYFSARLITWVYVSNVSMLQMSFKF